MCSQCSLCVLASLTELFLGGARIGKHESKALGFLVTAQHWALAGDFRLTPQTTALVAGSQKDFDAWYHLLDAHIDHKVGPV